MARHFALQVYVTALLDAHPAPATVREAAAETAERIRALLLASQFSDEDLADFEKTLRQLDQRLVR